MAKSNPSSRVTFWSAVVATAPWYVTALLFYTGSMKRADGPGQTAQTFMMLLTPIVLIAAARSLLLMSRGTSTGLDRSLTIAGAILIVFPYVFGIFVR